MSRFLPIAAVLGLLALLVYGLTASGTSDQIDQSLAEGEAPAAPGFELPILDQGVLPARLASRLGPAVSDGRLGLEELRGTPVVLNFWASWCDPCREEAPLLARGWAKDGPRGVLYLGLNMQDITGDALGFIDEFRVEYPTVREPGNETARAYGATGLPETYFISVRGRVVGHVIGVVTADQLEDGARAGRADRVMGTRTGGARREQR